MIEMTGLAVYLLIGIAIQYYAFKAIATDAEKYQNGLDELMEKKNQAETYEEKAKIREQILEHDKKYEWEVENKETIEFLNNERIRQLSKLFAAVAWPYAVARGIKALMDSKKK